MRTAAPGRLVRTGQDGAQRARCEVIESYRTPSPSLAARGGGGGLAAALTTGIGAVDESGDGRVARPADRPGPPDSARRRSAGQP